MRKAYTFILTLLPAEDENPLLRGKIQFITTGEEANFIGDQEMIEYVRKCIDPDPEIDPLTSARPLSQ